MSVLRPSLLSSCSSRLESAGGLATLGPQALLAAAVTVIAAGAAVAAADPTAGELFIRARLEPTAGILENPNFDLLILEVEEARGGNWLPPEARVRVVETLRGRLEPGWIATATWDRMGRWAGRRLQRPSPGTRFLAGATSAVLRNGTVTLHVVDAYEPSRENIEVARRFMEPPEPSPWPILILSTVGWTLLGLAMMLSGHWSRGLVVAGVLASALGTAVLFYNYERGMSPYTTIRLDALLVWPVAGSALALPGAVWWLIYRRSRGGAVRG
jgi:hypothetical protein